jgi:deoxyribodipyrimidine photo-lyase
VDDPGGAFVRQLCWRDFYHQVALAFPDLSTVAYRRGAREDWRYDPPEGEYVNRYAPR